MVYHTTLLSLVVTAMRHAPVTVTEQSEYCLLNNTLRYYIDQQHRYMAL